MRASAGLVLAALVACATAAASFDRLLYRSCDGVVEFASNGPFGAAFFPGFVDDALDGAIEAVRRRADCKCAGQFTNDEFDLLFDPVTAMLNNMQDNPVELPSTHCLKVNFPRNLQDLLVGRMVLPNTCSYNTWKNNGKCLVQLSIPAVDATVKLALGRCRTINNKASVIPFLSINCVGSGCAAATTPCGTNDACGAGTSCFAPLDYFNVTLTELPHKIFEGLQAIRLYAESETSPGCYQSPFVSDVSQRTPSNDIATRLLTVYNNLVTGGTGIFRNPKFCLPNQAIDMIHNATEGLEVTMPPQFTSGAANISSYTLPRHSCVLNGTEATQIELTYLTTWDGQLSSGSVLAQTPAIAAPTPAPSGSGAAYPLVRATCDGSLVFGRELFWMKANSNFMRLLNEVLSLVKDFEQCRTSPPMDKLTLIRHYFSNNPAFWLPFLDSTYNVPLTTNQHLFNNTLHYMVKTFMDSVSVGNLPETCNMNTWINTGKCTVLFTGLKRLLQLDVNPVLHVEECPSSNLVSYGVYCQGTDCEPLLGGLRPCNPSSANACPSTFECLDMFDAIESLAETIRNATNSDGGDSDGSGDTDDGVIIAEDPAPVPVEEESSFDFEKLKTHDMLEIVLGPNTAQDLCTWDSEYDNWNLTGITSEATCSGPNRFRNDLGALVVRIHGAPSAPTNPTTGTNFCMPTFDFIGDEEYLSDWVASLYSTAGSDIVFNDILPATFNPTTGIVETGEPTPTATQAPTSDPNAATTLAPALLAGIVAAVAAVGNGHMIM